MDEMAKETPGGVELEEYASERVPSTPPQHTTLRMTCFALFISLIGWLFNFDLGYGGTVLQMQSYRKAFGRCHLAPDPKTGATVETCSQTPLQQGLVALTFIFVALGGAFSGIVGNYFGRRGTVQLGALLAAIGAGGMLGTAGNLTAYLACKCIGGVGLGHLISAGPVYAAESLAANKRGFLLAIWSIGLALGSMAAAGVCWGSSRYTDSNLAWQIPIICQIPLSFIVGAGVCVFPESPRWLLTKGREEAAKRSFAWFNAKPADHSDILLQVQDVQRHIEMERLDRATTKWFEIFHGVDRRRTAVSGMIMVGLALSGSKFVGPYAALFLAKAGLKNPFMDTFILACCSVAGSIPGPWVVEYGGRRFGILSGYVTMTICMLVIAIVGSVLGPDSDGAKVILLIFLCAWAVLFTLFLGSSVWVSAPEQHNVRLRTYGQASTTFVYEIFGFAANFYTPYMLNVDYGNMGLNVGYFYGAITLVMTILTFLFVPETGRLTLEQIDEYYQSGRPAWKTSIKRSIRISKHGESDLSQGGNTDPGEKHT